MMINVLSAVWSVHALLEMFCRLLKTIRKKEKGPCVNGTELNLNGMPE